MVIIHSVVDIVQLSGKGATGNFVVLSEETGSVVVTMLKTSTEQAYFLTKESNVIC
jgi:hypothetical protein